MIQINTAAQGLASSPSWLHIGVWFCLDYSLMSLQQCRYACNEGARLLFRTQPLQHRFTRFSLLKHELLSESREEHGVIDVRLATPELRPSCTPSQRQHPSPPTELLPSRATPSRRSSSSVTPCCRRCLISASCSHFIAGLSFRGRIYAGVKTCLALLKEEGIILSLTLWEWGKGQGTSRKAKALRIVFQSQARVLLPW